VGCAELFVSSSTVTSFGITHLDASIYESWSAKSWVLTLSLMSTNNSGITSKGDDEPLMKKIKKSQ
jgi:hypothetical protein